MTSDKIPEIWLERFLLDELPPNEAEQVRQAGHNPGPRRGADPGSLRRGPVKAVKPKKHGVAAVAIPAGEC